MGGLIQKALIEPLADQLKSLRIHPEKLAYEIAKTKDKSINSKYPQDPYVRSIFKEYGQTIRATDEKVHEAFVALNAFQRGANLLHLKNKSRYYLRTIADDRTRYDLVFPIYLRRTITPIHSLMIKCGSLNSIPEGPLKLGCLLEECEIIQAICNRILSNTTFNSRKADGSEFARLISLFSSGGRCFDKNGLSITVKALFHESKRQRKELSEMLSQQLIRLCHNDMIQLVILTFNASSILWWRYSKHQETIQKLWRLIFGYMDRMEHPSEAHSADPLMEAIIRAMRDPDFEFEDLYTQIQMSAALQQCSTDNWRQNSDANCYVCTPTQSFEELFIQIQLPLTSAHVKNKSKNSTLFLPYELQKAIMSFRNFHLLPASCLQALNRLHRTLVPTLNLPYGLGKSPLALYVEDFRRQYEFCTSEAFFLLDSTTHEYCWEVSFQLSCGQLMQKKTDSNLYKLFEKLMRMLQGNWCQPSFKEKIKDFWLIFMENSGHSIDSNPFDKWVDLNASSLPPSEYFALICPILIALFETSSKDLAMIGLLYFENTQRNFTKEEVFIFFKKAFKSLVEQDIQSNSPLKTLLSLLSGHSELTPMQKWILLKDLYDFEKFSSDSKLELELFLSSVACLKHLNRKDIDDLPKINTWILRALQTKNLSHTPFSVISLVFVVLNLDLLSEANRKEFWELVADYTPQRDVEASASFVIKCLSLIKTCNYPYEFTYFLEELFTRKLDLNGLSKSLKNILPFQETNPVKDPSLKGVQKKLTFLDLPKESIVKLLRISLQKQLDNPFNASPNLLLFVLVEWASYSNSWEEKSIFYKIALILDKNDCLQENKKTWMQAFELFLTNQTEADAEMQMVFLSQSYDSSRKAQKTIANLFFEQILRLLTSEKDLNSRHYQKFVCKLLEYDASDPIWLQLKEKGAILTQCLIVQQLSALAITLWGSANFCSQEISMEFESMIFSALQEVLETQEVSLTLLDEVAKRLLGLTYFHKTSMEKRASWGTVCRKLAVKHRFQGDKQRALFWLEKEKGVSPNPEASLYKETFKLCSEIETKGMLRRAYSWISNIKIPQGMESAWIKMFNHMLAKECVKECNTLFKNHQTDLQLTFKTQKILWLDSIELIRKQLHSLKTGTDRGTIKYRNKLHYLMHHLMWSCFPREISLWKIYFEMLTLNGPLQLVEEAFKFMLEASSLQDERRGIIRKINENRLPSPIIKKPFISKFFEWNAGLTKTVEKEIEEVFFKEWFLDYFSLNSPSDSIVENGVELLSPERTCWAMLFSALSRKKSRLFFKLDEWWDPFWKALKSELSEKELEEESSVLIFHLLRGTAAYVQSPSFHYDRQIKKGLNTLCFLFKDRQQPWYTILCLKRNIQASLDLSRLMLASQNPDHLVDAVLCIVHVFTWIPDDPVHHFAIMDLINRCLPRALEQKNHKKLFNVMATALEFAIHNLPLDDADLFSILEYYFSVEKPMDLNGLSGEECSNALLENHIFLKRDIIEKVISCKWQKTHSFTEKDLRIFEKAILQLYHTPIRKNWDLLRDNLNNKVLTNHLSKNTLKKIENVKKTRSTSYIEELLFKRAMNLMLLERAVLRYGVMKKCNYHSYFCLMPIEKKAYQHELTYRYLRNFSQLIIVCGIAYLIFDIVNRMGE